MKILLVHAFYKDRGGEDAVVENEQAMLEAHGHRVETFFVHNNEIDHYSFLNKALLIPRTVYNTSRAVALERRLSEHFDLVHIHNIWPTISPAIFFILNELKQPYLQTIHNYRYIVPNAILYKDDVSLPDGILRVRPRRMNSFRNSYLLTATYWMTSQVVQKAGVINRGCGRLQLLNRLSYSIFSQLFDHTKLVIRGNFLPQKTVATMRTRTKENYYLYLGRLSEEKGIATLIRAFKKMDTDVVLKIAGTGPIEQELRHQYCGEPLIQFLGYVKGDEKMDLIARAKALVVPSEWQEIYPVSIMEANFCATPVLASRIGGLPDMVQEHTTGMLFESGDVMSLLETLRWCENNAAALVEMGRKARHFAQAQFSEEASYTRLMDIYGQIIQEARHPK